MHAHHIRHHQAIAAACTQLAATAVTGTVDAPTIAALEALLLALCRMALSASLSPDLVVRLSTFLTNSFASGGASLSPRSPRLR